MKHQDHPLKGTVSTHPVSNAAIPEVEGRLPSGSGIPPTGRYPVAGYETDDTEAGQDTNAEAGEGGDELGFGTATGETKGPGGDPTLTASVEEELEGSLKGASF